MTGQVLIIEDDTALRMSLAQTIELAGFTPIPTSSFVQARRTIRASFPGVVFSDIRMPNHDGFEVLRFTRSTDRELPVVLLTGHSDVPTAMRAMKEGAWDYLEKPCRTERLIDVLTRALDHRALALKSRRIERALLKNDVAAVGFPGAGKRSAALRSALRQAAQSTEHVHLWGEAGVGKKHAAYVINHLRSEDRRYLSVNMALTGEDTVRHIDPGSDGADLSCKNLDAASVSQQRDLVTLLDRHPEITLLSSSTMPLSAMAANTVVDEFLGHHASLEIRVPSLNERREDLPVIFETLLRLAVRGLSSDMPEMPDTLLSEIMTRDWSGNLPEMRAFAMSVALGNFVQNDVAANRTLAEQMDTFERLVISETLRRMNGRAVEAAKVLGLARNTFYDRLVKHGLVAKDFRSRGEGGAPQEDSH